jgi:hypothetical protein
MKNFCFFSIVFLLLSCESPSQKERELQNVLKKTLKFEKLTNVQKDSTLLSLEELKQNHGYLSLVYLQNSCSPCYQKYIEWQQKMDSIDTPDDYTVLFVIKGDSYGEFMTSVLDIEYVDDQFYTIMDPDGQFLEANKDIPRWIINASVLIDSENKIKMVGAPFATPEMTELFHEICAQ